MYELIRSSRLRTTTSLIQIDQEHKSIRITQLPINFLAQLAFHFSFYDIYKNSLPDHLKSLIMEFLVNSFQNTSPTIEMIITCSIFYKRIFKLNLPWALQQPFKTLFACCYIQAIKLLHDHSSLTLRWRLESLTSYSKVEHDFLSLMEDQFDITHVKFNSFRSMLVDHILLNDAFESLPSANYDLEHFENNEISSNILFKYTPINISLPKEDHIELINKLITQKPATFFLDLNKAGPALTIHHMASYSTVRKTNSQVELRSQPPRQLTHITSSSSLRGNYLKFKLEKQNLK